MDPYIAKFIEANKDLIEDNKWSEVYKNAGQYFLSSYTGELTQIFLECGIDPLKYLTYIPRDFLNGSKGIKSISIPNHIERIGDRAFFGCDKIERLIVPNSVKLIDDLAFGYCESLQEITLPGVLDYLGNNSFSGCSNLKSIIFGNIKEEWYDLTEAIKLSDSKRHDVTVHCVNGSIKVLI